MKRWTPAGQFRLSLSATLLILIWLACGHEVNATPASKGDVPSEVLVRFRADGGIPGRKGLACAIPGLQFVRTTRGFNIHVLRVQYPMDRESLIGLIQTLRNNPDVEWAEPNFSRYAYTSPDDPRFESQWHLQNTGQTGGIPGADIAAPDAWDESTGDHNVVVAVLDTGVEYTHSDLVHNMWKNTGEDWNADGSPGNNGIDDDSNGYADDYCGADVANKTGDPFDPYGHGTSVAGIIGAVGNNGAGVCGVAWNVGLMAVKFLDPYGTVSDEIEGISYILAQKDKGVPICAVNASFGGSEYSRFEEEAFQSLEGAGIMVAAAAGNEGGELGGYRALYPALYSRKNIISVAATDDADRLAAFSNYGFHYVDVAAPGENILTCNLYNTYGASSGTSMATPIVSGTLALLYSVRNRSISEARERILRGVDPSDGLSGLVFSGGRLNASKVLSVLLTGPFIFSIDPLQGDPGAGIAIDGVRFGTGPSEGSGVMMGGAEARIVEWRPERIVCQVPEDIGTAGKIELSVYTGEGNSNTVYFDLSPFRYRVPFAPAGSHVGSYLILCNYHEGAVHAQVFAGPSGSFVIQPQEEPLAPREVRYINLKDYGLSGERNLLWVESDRDIGVSLIVADIDLRGIYYIQGQSR